MKNKSFRSPHPRNIQQSFDALSHRGDLNCGMSRSMIWRLVAADKDVAQQLV
jgi:hypothetical protein